MKLAGTDPILVNLERVLVKFDQLEIAASDQFGRHPAGRASAPHGRRRS